MESSTQLAIFESTYRPEAYNPEKPSLENYKNNYRNRYTLAHDIFQSGKIEIITVFKGLQKSKDEGAFFETFLNLHGFPMLLSYPTKEEALESHRCLCKNYKDFMV